MRSERYGITLKVSQGTEELMLFADDGINPFRIPLTLEDAIQLALEKSIINKNRDWSKKGGKYQHK